MTKLNEQAADPHGEPARPAPAGLLLVRQAAPSLKTNDGHEGACSWRQIRDACHVG